MKDFITQPWYVLTKREKVWGARIKKYSGKEGAGGDSRDGYVVEIAPEPNFLVH